MAPGGAAAGASDWTTGLDAELRTAINAKGYKSPADLAKAYVSLERTVGLDKLPLPPKGADGKRDLSKWDGWTALGRPESADKYDLAAFKAPDGVKLDDARTKAALTRLHQAGYTQDQAIAALTLHAEEVAWAQAQGKEAGKQADAKLHQSWGANYDANMRHAENAIAALGLSNEFLQMVRDTGHAESILVKLAEIGGKYFGEGRGALPRDDGGGGAATGAGAAKAEIEQIKAAAMADSKHAYWDPRHPEHKALHERMLALNAIVAGEQAAKEGRAQQ